MAARGVVAAAGNAGDRVSQRRIAGWVRVCRSNSEVVTEVWYYRFMHLRCMSPGSGTTRTTLSAQTNSGY